MPFDNTKGSTGHPELLISVAVIASNDAERDVAELHALLDLVQKHTPFFELMILSAPADERWLSALKHVATQIPNMRILLFDSSYLNSIDRLMVAALELAIGDVILVVTPSEFTTADLNEVMKEGLSGQYDIVKTCHDKSYVARYERLFVALGSKILRATTGYAILPFPGRTLFLNRTAVDKILGSSGLLRYVRILDTGQLLREKIVRLVSRQKPRPFADIRRKLAVAANLSASAAPRLLGLFTVSSLGLSFLGLAFGIYTILVLLFKDEVAAGWASISLVLSTMFMMLFAMLAMVALGVIRIINLQESKEGHQPIQEIGKADLFGKIKNRNVDYEGRV